MKCLIVNGLPLFLFEFKNLTQNLRTDYNDSITDYKDSIPQLFWYNTLIFFSNGGNSCIGNLTTHKRHLIEWKHNTRTKDETEEVSLHTLLKQVCVPERLLNIIENLTLHKHIATQQKNIEVCKICSFTPSHCHSLYLSNNRAYFENRLFGPVLPLQIFSLIK